MWRTADNSNDIFLESVMATFSRAAGNSDGIFLASMVVASSRIARISRSIVAELVLVTAGAASWPSYQSDTQELVTSVMSIMMTILVWG